MILFNIVLITLSILGLSLLVLGLQKNKQSYNLFGGVAFLVPIFYLIGWIYLLPLVPPIALAISLISKKRGIST